MADASRGSERAGWILEAARQLLAADGPESLTVHRIAERAGLSVGSLYRHFPSKEAIVEAVFVREVEAALAFYESTEPDFGGTDLRGQLERAISAAVARHLELLRLHPEYARRNPHLLSVTTTSPEGRSRARQFVERMLLHYRAELRTDLDLDSAIFLLTDGVASLLQAAVRDEPALLEGDRFGPHLAELFHRYLTVVGAPPPNPAERGGDGGRGER